jgi:lipopolysaccharide biosynthesis glycosyltransferase
MAQDRSRWDRLVFVHVSKGWNEIQKEYYAELGERNTGERWVRLLIQKLWKTASDKWDHRDDVLHRLHNMVSQAEADMMNSQISDFSQSVLKLSFLRIGTFS